MRADTTWFKECGWGVFNHYLTKPETTADEWNRQVDSFDVNRLADQLASAGTPYCFITVGQISGHYCSPNATYDDIVGIRPSKCSQRDLVVDLADALEPRGIRLLVYVASEGPGLDVTARQRLGWVGNHWNEMDDWTTAPTTWSDKRQTEFQKNWEPVIREWALRWGQKVRGWWVDGCYHADLFYAHPEPPNFQSFLAALKAGNPDRIVALNPGVFTPVISRTEHEDFVCGEIADALPVGDEVGRNDLLGGAQYHILSYLGPNWGKGPPRFRDALPAAYSQFVVERGGVITWDVPIEKDGRIPDEFIRQLAAIGRAVG